MSTIILRTASGPLVVLLLGFAMFMLLRGHNAPGGGFIAALVAAGAVALHVMAYPEGKLQRRLPRLARGLLGGGLVVALVSAGLAAFVSAPPLTGLWVPGSDSGIALGTPLLFDLGVCATVTGFVLLCFTELGRR